MCGFVKQMQLCIRFIVCGDKMRAFKHQKLLYFETGFVKIFTYGHDLGYD